MATVGIEPGRRDRERKIARCFLEVSREAGGGKQKTSLWAPVLPPDRSRVMTILCSRCLSEPMARKHLNPDRPDRAPGSPHHAPCKEQKEAKL